MSILTKLRYDKNQNVVDFKVGSKTYLKQYYKYYLLEVNKKLLQ